MNAWKWVCKRGMLGRDRGSEHDWDQSLEKAAQGRSMRDSPETKHCEADLRRAHWEAMTYQLRKEAYTAYSAYSVQH